MNFMDVLRVLLASLPFLLLSFLNKTANLKREYRGYQFASIFYGIIFTIVAVILSDDLSDQLLMKINQLSSNLAVYAEQKPQFADVFLQIKNFLDSVNWEMYIIFIVNFLVLLIFILSKKILLPVFKSIWKNETLFNATSGHFYSWSNARKFYTLKNNFYSLKILMNVYYIAVIIIATVLLILCRLNYEWDGFRAVFYPFALVIVLGEVVFFLGGKAEAEFIDDIGGDGGSSSKIVNYYRLRKYLTSVFGDRAIAQDTELPKYFAPHNNSEIVKKYENIDEQEAKIINLYFAKLNESGVQLNEELVDATYRLINGESILFVNPFYKDYSNYIFLPLNRAVSKGGKILFVLGRNGIEDDVAEWINNSFSNVICIENMWEVGKLNSEHCFSGDIGIVASSDIFNSDLVATNLNFLKEVTQVVLIEPSLQVSVAQMSLALFISEVREDSTFYIIDKNSDGLIDTLSHILRKSIKEVTAASKERNRFSYMMWKADGRQLNHRLFPNVARYLGVGTELMIAGIRNQINLAEWYSYSKFPVTDMKWISEQYYAALCNYASLNPKQEEIAKRMQFNNNLWSSEKAKHKYLVVEDEYCNMFEMARQFASRGSFEAFVNVVSQNYLLREYMEYNSDLFEADSKAIPSFCPDYARTERNIVIELLLKLAAGPTPKSEILRVLKHIENLTVNDDCPKYELKCIVYNLINKYFQNECASFIVTETTLLEDHDDYYCISNLNFVKAATKFLNCAYFITEDELSGQHYLDSKLLGHVYQSMLPGQHITINGKYYEVMFIDDDKGVIVKRAADGIHSREYYRQIRSYVLESFDIDQNIGARKTIGNIIVESGKLNFCVLTSGYLLMQDYGDIKNALTREISDIPKRYYSGKSGLRITLPGTTARIRATICLILNEIFKTTYPNGCDYVCALTDLSELESIPQGIMYSLDCKKSEDSEYIYIIEDSILDLGIISSLERNLKRFFEIVTDYLKWHELAVLPIPVIKDNDIVEVPDIQITEKDSSQKQIKKSVREKIKSFIKNMFGNNKGKTPKKKPYIETPSDDGLQVEDSNEIGSQEEQPSEDMHEAEHPADDLPQEEISSVQAPPIVSSSDERFQKEITTEEIATPESSSIATPLSVESTEGNVEAEAKDTEILSVEPNDTVADAQESNNIADLPDGGDNSKSSGGVTDDFETEVDINE